MLMLILIWAVEWVDALHAWVNFGQNVHRFLWGQILETCRGVSAPPGAYLNQKLWHDILNPNFCFGDLEGQKMGQKKLPQFCQQGDWTSLGKKKHEGTAYWSWIWCAAWFLWSLESVEGPYKMPGIKGAKHMWTLIQLSCTAEKGQLAKIDGSWGDVL